MPIVKTRNAKRIFISYAYGDTSPAQYASNHAISDDLAPICHAEWRRAPTLSEYDRDSLS